MFFAGQKKLCLCLQDSFIFSCHMVRAEIWMMTILLFVLSTWIHNSRINSGTWMHWDTLFVTRQLRGGVIDASNYITTCKITIKHSPLLYFFANGQQKHATRISDMRTHLCRSRADIPDDVHPAAAADHINHGVGACQLQLEGEGSSLNYAFVSLLRSGESAQISACCPDVMTCDTAPWQLSCTLY